MMHTIQHDETSHLRLSRGHEFEHDVFEVLEVDLPRIRQVRAVGHLRLGRVWNEAWALTGARGWSRSSGWDWSLHAGLPFLELLLTLRLSVRLQFLRRRHGK